MAVLPKTLASPIVSISSIKIIVGACSRARKKISFISLTAYSYPLFNKTGAEMVKKETFNSCAAAFIINVFPHPGGPNINNPFIGLILYSSIRFGCSKGTSIASNNTLLISSKPATSSHLISSSSSVISSLCIVLSKSILNSSYSSKLFNETLGFMCFITLLKSDISIGTTFFSLNALFAARAFASLHMFAISAPEYLRVFLANFLIETFLDKGRLFVCTLKISSLASSSGNGI